MSQSKKQKIQIQKPCASIYRRSENPGDVIEIDEKQADEMIQSGHAKKTTKKVGPHKLKEKKEKDQDKEDQDKKD